MRALLDVFFCVCVLFVKLLAHIYPCIAKIVERSHSGNTSLFPPTIVYHIHMWLLQVYRRCYIPHLPVALIMGAVVYTKYVRSVHTKEGDLAQWWLGGARENNEKNTINWLIVTVMGCSSVYYISSLYMPHVILDWRFIRGVAKFRNPHMHGHACSDAVKPHRARAHFPPDSAPPSQSCRCLHCADVRAFATTHIRTTHVNTDMERDVHGGVCVSQHAQPMDGRKVIYLTLLGLYLRMRRGCMLRYFFACTSLVCKLMLRWARRRRASSTFVCVCMLWLVSAHFLYYHITTAG